MHILTQDIHHVVSLEKEYRFGRFLDVHQMLERMTVSLDEGSHCYRINARVQEQGQKYVLSMKINQQGEVIHYHCSCHYETSTSACRHCAAILFFLKQLDISSFPYFYEKNSEVDKIQKYQRLEKEKQERILNKKHHESMNLIELYKDRLLREAMIPLSTQQYQLKVYTTQKQDHLEISLKIVHDSQPYVIKNIATFLHAIEYHESLKYGKNFEFVHSRDAFDADSLEILAFVEEAFVKNQALQKGIIKNLLIDKSLLDQFYDLMYNLPSRYSDIAFETKTSLILLEVNEKDDSYVLDFKDYQNFNDVFMSYIHLYELNQDVLYRLSLDSEGKCLILIQKLLESQGGLYIPKNAIEDFYRYILIDILEYIQLDTTLFDNYRQENMINLYADITRDEQICVQLEYIYDDGIAYGFDEQNKQLSKEADVIESYLRPYIEDEDEHVIYLQYDHDFAYSFIKEGLPYLSNYCQVYVSDALKSLSTLQDIQIQIGVNMSHHLLEINIDSVQIDKSELFDILKAYKKKRKFYKLKNGQMLSLESQELQELSDLTHTLQLTSQDFQQQNMSIPAYRLFEIENLSNQQSHVAYLKSQTVQDFIDGFQKPKAFEVPHHYQNILREYQKSGYEWLCSMQHYGFSGILADDMGLGKTLQMIVYLEKMKTSHQPSLVITPASLLLNWQDEMNKFSQELKVLPIYGSKVKRDQDIQKILDYDVIITSYDYIRRDIEQYETISFHTIILDEAQYIKNPKTRSALSVKRLKSLQRFALTGTPIENSLAELWSIFDFLMPHYLYHYSYFLENYEKPIVKNHDEDKQHQLKQMISPFILRRNKKDVLKELPPKIEQTMYLHFNEDEEKLYLSTLVQVNKKLQEKLDIHQLGKIDILAMLTRLRQICQEPRLLYDEWNEPSSKLKGCMELIHSLKDNGKKILLFSSFTSVLELIGEQCQKEHISFYQLDGSTPKEKRKKLVDQFQQDDTTLFLISLKAGGSGLNLTSAGAVIHYDPWWNMSAQNQATDRAHRIGQTESVQVFSLIMKNSIEEKIMELQKQKKNLADAFVEGNEGTITTMTLENMKAILSLNNETA